MTRENGETYVSFKWMLAQTLALIVSIITIGFLIVSSVNGKIETGLNSKVSLIQFEERTKALMQVDSEMCKLIDQYSREKIITNERLGLIEQHLAIMVGKPLGKSRLGEEKR